MITFIQKGDFKKTNTFLKRLQKRDYISILNKYGEIGINALAGATPKDTGETAASWTYTIEKKNDEVRLVWKNTNTTDTGIPIVIFIQYGHATRGGTYVEGRDFINPVMQPIFDRIAEELWNEIKEY